jgi:hypothetical protein
MLYFHLRGWLYIYSYRKSCSISRRGCSSVLFDEMYALFYHEPFLLYLFAYLPVSYLFLPMANHTFIVAEQGIHKQEWYQSG